jgi:hypothetical protein
MARRKKSEQADASATQAAADAAPETQPAKRKRGRPKKSESASVAQPSLAVKRGPGRPRKTEASLLAAAGRKPGRRGRPRKASTPSIGQQIDDLIRQLHVIKERVSKMETSAGTLDRVLSVLKS